MTEYRNLALQGGGVWGIAYAGAFEELGNLGILQRIEKVAGTSAGSIFGLLVALGYSAPEMSEIIQGLDYSKFQDHGSIKHVPTQYGYYAGNYALEVFHGWIETKLGNPQATFRDLNNTKGKELKVYATDLNTGEIAEFSYSRTPDVPMALAVRASMAVPLFFTAVEINNHIYVDGGAVFDYPLMGFGKGEILNTLGLAFMYSSAVPKMSDEDESFSFNQFHHYIPRMVKVIENVQSPVIVLQEDLKKNTVVIDTGEVSSLNFKITTEEKDLLVANGRQAVRDHFSINQSDKIN